METVSHTYCVYHVWQLLVASGWCVGECTSVGPLTFVCRDDVHAVPLGGVPDTHGAIIRPSHSASERMGGRGVATNSHTNHTWNCSLYTQTYIRTYMWLLSMSMQETQLVCPLRTASGKDWTMSHTMHCVSQEPVTKHSSLHCRHLTPPCTGQGSNQHHTYPWDMAEVPLSTTPLPAVVCRCWLKQGVMWCLPCEPAAHAPPGHSSCHGPCTRGASSKRYTHYSFTHVHTYVRTYTHTRVERSKAGYLAVMSADPEITFRRSNVAQVMAASCACKERNIDWIRMYTS